MAIHEELIMQDFHQLTGIKRCDFVKMQQLSKFEKIKSVLYQSSHEKIIKIFEEILWNENEKSCDLIMFAVCSIICQDSPPRSTEVIF